jgi:hypothetical protein
MKGFAVSFALLIATLSCASAQTIPDLKGNWVGKGKAVVFGTNAHHPGSQRASDPARVREIETTHMVEGQDGRVAWGHSSSAAADTKEPFVWALSSDNKSITGADMDGYFRITLLGRDRMEKCYVHNGTSRDRLGSRGALRDATEAVGLKGRRRYACGRTAGRDRDARVFFMDTADSRSPNDRSTLSTVLNSGRPSTLNAR